MEKIYHLNYAENEVKVCIGNTCIQARGDNARLISVAFVLLIICVGIAVLSNS